MRARKKWLWLIFGIAAIVAGALTWSISTTRPPIILTLPTGDRYRFVGITYGTNTVLPGMLAKVLNLLPVKTANAINQKLNFGLPPFPRSPWIPWPPVEPMYRFWFRRIGMSTNWGPFNISAAPKTHDMFIVDQSGHLGGQTAFLNPYGGQYSVVVVSALPRRDPQLDCRFYTHDPSFPQNVPQTDIIVPNPFYGHFPQWTPEPIPNVKTNGDLEVRLDDFYVMHPDGHPAGVVASDFSVRSPTDAKWALAGWELGDITSNRIRFDPGSGLVSPRGALKAVRPSWRDAGELGLAQLWLDEDAWRLKVTLGRRAGFESNEIITLANLLVPVVGSSNILSLTNDGKVFNLVLSQTSFGIIHDGVNGGASTATNTHAIQIEWHSVPNGSETDFVNAYTDTGASLDFLEGIDGLSTTWSLYNLPLNAHTFSMTIVIQKPRTVEFLVKPPKTN